MIRLLPAAVRLFVGLALSVATISAQGTATGERRYAVTGMVLEVDVSTLRFVASTDTIPGFMDAMTMPFAVRRAADLAGLTPGAVVAFTLIVGRESSHAEDIVVRRYQGLEQDPLAARRLALLRQIGSGAPTRELAIGAVVPNFTLIDHKSRRATLSDFRGKVVALNFMYTTCQLPDFCLRVVNHFGVLQKQFASRLGRDLIFLTITFDPARDTPEVLDAYAAQWMPNPNTWRFLTGPPNDVQRVLEWFGVSAFPNDGLMDHTLHTAVIGRSGKLVANVEGNQFSTDQLAALLTVALRAAR